MLENVNIEAVRNYNSELKMYKEQASKLAVEIEINEKELNTLCQQLTAELGVSVTPENVEQIYNEQVAKINQTLETGNAVLQKIKQEASGTAQTQAPSQAQTVQPVQPAQQTYAQPQQTYSTPVQTQVNNVQTQPNAFMQNAGVQTPVFNNAATSPEVSQLPNPSNMMNNTINGNKSLFSM